MMLCFLVLAGCNFRGPVQTPEGLEGGDDRPPEGATLALTPAPEATDLAAEPDELITPGGGAVTHPAEAQTPPPARLDLPRPRYVLDVTYTEQSHHLEVRQEIAYTNRTPETFQTLPLVVDALRYPGVFRLRAITWADGTDASYRTSDGIIMDVALVEPLAPGAGLRLVIEYSLDLPNIARQAEISRPNPFGYTSRQTNLVDWYPFVPPYRSPGGWIRHNPWYFGEHLTYEASDFEVNLTVIPNGWPLTVAASAPAIQNGDSYHYTMDSARTFVWSVSNMYAVISQTVGTTTLYSYSFPFGAAGSQRALQDTAQAVELYSELFGPYPYESLSVVEADFLDGMEYSGLYFLSYGFYDLYNGTPQGYLTAIAVHETGHQWWYGALGNNQALDPWLDEAFGTYMERLYYERYYPELLDWWWDFRINYYAPQGTINRSIYDFEGFTPYRNAVYLHGAEFFEEVRQQMGDEAFFAFLHTYADRYRDEIVTTADFLALLRDHAGAEIEPVIAAFFE